jgi:hypothetical protein
MTLADATNANTASLERQRACDATWAPSQGTFLNTGLATFLTPDALAVVQTSVHTFNVGDTVPGSGEGEVITTR